MAIGAGFALGLALALVFTDVARTANFDRFIVPAISCACAFALAALVLGLLDDIMALPPRAKFVIMALLGIGVALLVARAEDMPMFGRWTIHLGVVAGVLGTALWVFVMMNATNFMDGTNGLAMGSSAISLAALALISALCGAPAAALMAIAGAGALVGFLVWNFPKAKLFAGDSGALFAGMLGAVTALVAMHEGGISVFVMPVLFFPALADTLLTLAWRVSRKRDVLDGHREHFYQIGLRADFKPEHVAICYWLATLGCASAGVAAAVIHRYAAQAPDVGEAVTFLASIAPQLALLILAIIAVWLSTQVRAFSIARGLDGE